MKAVELKTAYHWHCDTCSEENFSLPEKLELTDDKAEEMFRYFNNLGPYADLPDDWRDFEVVKMSDTVTCKNCGEKFLTTGEERV